MAAALQGFNLISPEQLPRFWEAYAQLEQVPDGVIPSPCDFIRNAAPFMNDQGWTRRKSLPWHVSSGADVRELLGFKIRLPAKAIDYPLDVAGRADTPWVWQMRRALSVLRMEAQRYYAQPEHYGTMVEVAFRYRPADIYARGIRAGFIEIGPRNATWVESQIRLVLETEDDPNAGSSSIYMYTGEGDEDHMRELVCVGYVLILQRTHNPKIAYWAAYDLARLAAEPYSQPRKFPKATATLAIAHWRHLLPKELSPMLDKALAKAYAQPGSPFKFEEWVEGERSELEAAAADELPRLSAFAAEIHQKLEPISTWNLRTP